MALAEGNKGNNPRCHAAAGPLLLWRRRRRRLPVLLRAVQRESERKEQRWKNGKKRKLHPEVFFLFLPFFCHFFLFFLLLLASTAMPVRPSAEWLHRAPGAFAALSYGQARPSNPPAAPGPLSLSLSLPPFSRACVCVGTGPL
jgi:hypothetical protein